MKKYMENIITESLRIISHNTIRFEQPKKMEWVEGEFPFRSVADHKFSIMLLDGNSIEAGVFELIVEGKKENHICLSTQAGCRFRCAMCSSGKRGFSRNLTVQEIAGQVTILAEALGTPMFDQIIFMGIGEPLDNYDNFIGGIKKIVADNPDHVGKISFATVGLAERLDCLSDAIHSGEIPPFKMVWLSLHAATDEKRNIIMPVNRTRSIAESLKAVRNFSQKHPSTDVWLNYLVYCSFNDSMRDAIELAKITTETEKDFSLMLSEPNNDFLRYKKGNQDDLARFESYLKKAGIKNRISQFKSAGKDVNAGCGEFIFKPTSTNP